MNKFFRLAAVAFLLWSGVVLGDGADSPLANVPAPQPPFVARAPAQSSWLIVITPKGESTTDSLGTHAKYLKAQLWTKAVTAMQCANEWSDGTRTEDTVIGSAKIAQSPDGNGVHLFNPKSDPRYHDFSSGDFEMLDWITTENYVGAFNHAGERCYLFQTKGAKNAASEPHNLTLVQINTPTSPTSVYISIGTGLPVEIDNTQDQYLFRFGSPGELKFPEDQPALATPPSPPPPPSTTPPIKPKANKPLPTPTPPSASKPVKKPEPVGNNGLQSE